MKRTALIASAVAMIAAVCAMLFWMQLVDARKQAAMLGDRVAQLEAAVAAGQRPSSASLNVSMPGNTSGLSSSNTSPMKATNEKNSSVVAPLDHREQGGPGSAREAQMKMNFERRYPDLAKEIGLTPGEADALFDLMVKRNLGVGARSTTDLSPAERAAAFQKDWEANEDAIRALLGEDKYQKLQQYQETAGIRQQVTQLRAALNQSEEPLTDEQAKALIAIASAEQSRSRAEERQIIAAQGNAGVDVRSLNLNATQASTRQTFEKARSVLTAKQLAAYEQLLYQRSQMQAIQAN